LNVTYYVYKDVQLDFQANSDEEAYARARRSRTFQSRRFSFVSMCWHSGRQRLYCGTTNPAGDLLVEFNPKTGKFRTCGYHKSGLRDETELKIHKGIWLDERDDSLVFATSTLSPISDTIDTPGGKLIRYHIADRRFEMIAQPMRGQFYQATNYDAGRDRAYLFTMPGLGLCVVDTRTGALIRSDAMESIPHVGAIDDDGGVWGTWSFSRHAFFRYLPDEDRYEFPKGCAFPEAPRAANVMYPGAGPIDSMVNGGDGFLYAGSALGEVVRIDPRTGAIQYLGKPFPGRRLPGMTVADDGYIYLCGGSDGAPHVARYNRDTEAMEYLGRVVADDGTTCFRCHELAVVDGTAYVGETDNRSRSGYIWACEP
jgi:hypothetical protein